MSYDSNNIFAKILRGEIPAKKLYEDQFAVAFPDISPSAPTHVLVIPKGNYQRYDDFIANATDAEIAGFFKAVRSVAAQLGVDAYRLITNNGESVGQSVHHFHVHILGGKKISALLPQ
jgi:diadenosine tetraphosphate (Ap4A) HIT family hydrolase